MVSLTGLVGGALTLLFGLVAVYLIPWLKPLELMRQLVRICVPGGRILDPFCGSGTTLEAAVLEGYSAVGMECSEWYAGVARERVAGWLVG